MHQFLEYDEPSDTEQSLSHTPIEEGSVVYSGEVRYSYQTSYPETRGIKKGLRRMQEYGLIPGSFVPTGTAFLEEKSNNILPALSHKDLHPPQYVKVRGGSVLLNPSPELRADILVSQCLFGVTGNSLVMESGSSAPITSPKSNFDSNITHLEIDNIPSLYEAESIARQVELVRSLTYDNPHYTSLTIGLPRAGYYLHALKPYTAGLLSPELTTAWFDAVDHRHELVLAALRKSLEFTNLPIRIETPLNGIEEVLRTTVLENRPIKLHPLLARLAISDSHWNTVLASSTPHDLYQLKGDFADAVEELRVPAEATYRIVVKSPKEEGTFELKDTLAKRADIESPIVALYSLPQIITKTPGIGLYQMKKIPTPEDIQRISKQYEHYE